MTWLSEIENDIEDYPEDWHGKVGEDGRRMARVIRELAPRVMAYEWIMRYMPNPVTDTIRDKLEALGILDKRLLSPDAKEVINDTTAPRST